MYCIVLYFIFYTLIWWTHINVASFSSISYCSSSEYCVVYFVQLSGACSTWKHKHYFYVTNTILLLDFQIKARDEIKELLQTLLPKFKRKVNKELEEKNRMLRENPGLLQLYKDLVLFCSLFNQTLLSIQLSNFLSYSGIWISVYSSLYRLIVAGSSNNETQWMDTRYMSQVSLVLHTMVTWDWSQR